MIFRFPHEQAYLPRTRLSYVNLPGILSDAKRERAARVPGYVAIQLGDRCYLIFIRDGEPFHAAHLEKELRAPVALAEVLRLVATESERGESGQIGYFGACEDQLRAMLSALLTDAIIWDEPLDPARPDHFFPRLRDRRFGGVLELRDADGCHHYLRFLDGAFQCGYFSQHDGAVPVPEFLRGLFTSGAPLRASLHPDLPELPEQAGPGLVDLYRRIVGGIMRDLSGAVGRETAVALLRRAQTAAAAEHPAAAAFELTDEGRVAGDPVAAPEALTDAVAAWVTEALIAASDGYGIDPAGEIEKVARDSRFVLQERGFFARLPWALAI